MRCKECKFVHYENEIAWCRKNAPQVVVGPDGPIGMWPPVDEDAYCHEFAPALMLAKRIPQFNG